MLHLKKTINKIGKYKLSGHQYDKMNYSHALSMHLKTVDLSGSYLMTSSGEKDSGRSLFTTYPHEYVEFLIYQS